MQDKYKEVMPPHNLDAERSVLGSILIDPDCLFDISLIIKPESFFSGTNRVIYEGMLHLLSKKTPIDFTTISARIGDKIDDAGGIAILADLMGAVPTAINAKHYARIIQNAFERRQLLDAASRIAVMAHDEDEDDPIGSAKTIMVNMDSRLSDIGDISMRGHMREIIEDLLSEDPPASGILSGYYDLDRYLQFRDGELIFIAARPGMGKTALMLSMCPAIVKQNKRVLFVSLEMFPKQIAYRLLCAKTNTTFQYLQDLRLGADGRPDETGILESAGEISDYPLLVYSPTILTPSSLISTFHHYSMKYGSIDLIMIDYLTRMTSDGKERTQYERVSSISTGLKVAARELKVPVIVAAQLSRTVEQRQDKRPILSDLRDSGTLEQDADAVIFIYRDDYYHPNDSDRPNVAEIIVAKNKNGPTCTIDLYYKSTSMAFRNLKVQEISLPTLTAKTEQKY